MKPYPAKAVPAGTLRLENGKRLPIPAGGTCLYCGDDVTQGRDMAGATTPLDPCWNVDGDFGCARSPWTCKEGTGDHATTWDLRRLDLGYDIHGKRAQKGGG